MPNVTPTDIFDDLDRMDADGWLSHMAPDVVMRFAGEDPVYGHAGSRAVMRAFFEDVSRVDHEIVDRWEHGNTTIVEATVTLGIPDGADVTLPMVTTYRTNATGLIVDYRVYIDPRPLTN